MSSTGVTMNISNHVFKIGKERRRIDFCVIKKRIMNLVFSNIDIRDDS